MQSRGHPRILSELFRSIHGSCPRDYLKRANHDGLYGPEDPRGPVGMTSTRKRGPQCSQLSLGGLTK
jgi:hypothetical protein